MSDESIDGHIARIETRIEGILDDLRSLHDEIAATRSVAEENSRQILRAKTGLSLLVWLGGIVFAVLGTAQAIMTLLNQMGPGNGRLQS